MGDRESSSSVGLFIKQEVESDEEELPPPAMILVPKQELIEEDSRASCSLAHSTSQEILNRNFLRTMGPSLSPNYGEVPTNSKEADDSREMNNVMEKLQSGEYILIKKERSRSKVWEKFASVYDAVKKIYMGYVQCTSCGQLLSMKLGSGTTHLSRHVCKLNSGGPVLPASKRLENQVLDSCLEKCVAMCMSDIMPSTVITGKGFLDLGQELIKIGSVYGNVNISSILPPVDVLAHRLIKSLHHIRGTVVGDVQKAIHDGVCALEVWSEKVGNLNKILVSCQYVTDDWNLRNQVLFSSWCFNSKEYDETLIQEEVQMKLCSLGICSAEERSKCTVVRNRPYVVNNTLLCATHSIGNVVKEVTQDTFLTYDCPEIWRCVRAGKNIVRFLKSKGLMSKLHVQQTSYPYWTSAVFILETVFYNHEYIVKMLTEMKENALLSDWNNELVSEIMAILSKFKDALSDIQTRAYPTLHLIVVYIYELSLHCSVNSSDHQNIANFKRQAKYLLEVIDIDQKHYIATFLCPHTRLLKQLSPDKKARIHDVVRSLCEEVNKPPVSSVQPPPLKRSRFGAWSQYEDDRESSFDEVALYIATGRQESEDPADLLSWWQGKAKIFPKLSKVARKVFCIPATCSSWKQVSGLIRMSLMDRLGFSCDEESDLFLYNSVMADGPLIQAENLMEESPSQSV